MLESFESRLLISGLLLIFLVGIFLCGYTVLNGIVLSCFLTLISLLLLMRAVLLKNMIMILLFIFFLSYSVVARYLFIDNIPISVHKSFGEPIYGFYTMLVHSLFLIFFYLSIKIRDKKTIQEKQFKNNPIIFYLCSLIFLYGIIFGISGENMFVSGGYSIGDVQTSSFNEYVIIFFICAYIYSGGIKFNVNILKFLFVLFVLKNFAFGGRIVSLMLILAFFVLRFRYTMKFNFFIVCVLIGGVFMTVFENIRQNPLILIDGDIMSCFSIGNNQNITLHVSNQGDVFQSTSRLIGMTNENILTLYDRFISFLYFGLSIILPYSILPDLANLPTYMTNVYPVGGGGLVSGFFYVFFGFVGVITIAVFLGYFLSCDFNKTYKVKDFYFIMLCFTFPRWFAYNPIIIFKLCLYGILVFFFFSSLDYTLKKYNKVKLH